MKFLLVENNPYSTRLLIKDLVEHHYVVEVAKNGREGWELIRVFNYDLLLLDVIQPSLDSLNLCRRLREAGNEIPILFLSALPTIADKVIALDAGADDYAIKPYNLSELLARIRALLRRGNPCTSSVKKWGDLLLNSGTCEASYQHLSVVLTPIECRLLELFLQRGYGTIAGNTILDSLWTLARPPRKTSLKSYIKRLRLKLQTIGAPSDSIETVRGLGYRLNQRWQNFSISQKKNCWDN